MLQKDPTLARQDKPRPMDLFPEERVTVQVPVASTMRGLKPVTIASRGTMTATTAAANSTNRPLERHPLPTMLSQEGTGPPTPPQLDSTKEERVKVLVKEHVSYWEQFRLAQTQEDQPGMRKAISQAKKSQISLQKLIPKKEVEGYVQNWNPWDQLASLKGKDPKKKRSSAHQKLRNPKDWDNIIYLARKWKRVYHN